MSQDVTGFAGYSVVVDESATSGAFTTFPLWKEFSLGYVSSHENSVFVLMNPYKGKTSPKPFRQQRFAPWSEILARKFQAC